VYIYIYWLSLLQLKVEVAAKKHTLFSSLKAKVGIIFILKSNKNFLLLRLTGSLDILFV
jgi:hypothetical protein